MASDRKQIAQSSGTSSIKTSSDKEELVSARALKRAERVEARRVEAEKRKEAGNVHFRAGEYDKAINEYEAAIRIHGPSAPYLSNLAAVWLKLEMHDEAELCAQRALFLDPKFIRARYRRGLARKGNLEFAKAAIDFQTVLKQEPSSTEAKDALRETLNLMPERERECDDSDEDEDNTVVSDDELPLLSDNKVELESVSDSSDWNHEGNGIPCRFYNHDGCKRGNDCRFSHAPDHKSVRDRLGRNVCMYFLLGNCKFRGSACVYSHDRAYLPAGRWWEDDGKSLVLRHISNSLHPDQHSAFMPFMFSLVDDRLAWASAHGVEMEEIFGHWRVPAINTLHEAIDVALVPSVLKIWGAMGGPSKGKHVPRRGGGGGGGGRQGKGNGGGRRTQNLQISDDDDDLMEERRNNFGFTEDEAMELLSQGVKPWDDDARDVYNVLYSM